MMVAIRRAPRPFAIGTAVLVALVGALLVLGPGPSGGPTAVATPSASLATSSPEPSSTPIALAPSSSSNPSPSSSPATGVADLTGVTADDALAHRLPIAVLIDDNRVARPQSGFNGASLVYQAPADGGETRYMFVYQEGDSPDIGPVRSGRIYFVHWAAESRAAIAHYGGDRISRTYFAAHDGRLFTDIDALRTMSRPFHRISTRAAPHNAYTSTAALRSVIERLGGPPLMPPELGRRPFVDESPEDARGKRQTIRIPYPTGIIGYEYDRAANVYRRTLDGRKQVDPADGRDVTTRNVVVLCMSFRIDPTLEQGHARPVIGDVGTGKALVFREGRAIVGTWQKGDDAALTRLYDAHHVEIPLVRGRTFIQVVPIGTDVTPAR